MITPAPAGTPGPGAISRLGTVSIPQAAEYPGQTIGLPESGPGSLASWFARIAALILDWGASMLVATFLFGDGVIREGGWKAWMILAVFFVQSAVLTALTGSSFGQLLARIGIHRLDGHRLGWARAVTRAAMICLVLPTVVVGAERRALNDLVLGTVVVNRR